MRRKEAQRPEHEFHAIKSPHSSRQKVDILGSHLNVVVVVVGISFFALLMNSGLLHIQLTCSLEKLCRGYLAVSQT